MVENEPKEGDYSDAIVLEDGEPHHPRIRGVAKKMVESLEERYGSDGKGCVPARTDLGLRATFWLEWCKFCKHNIEGVTHKLVKQSKHSSEFEEVVKEYWDNSEEIQEQFKENAYWCHDSAILINVKRADELGGIEELLEEYDAMELSDATGESGPIKDGRDDDDSEDPEVKEEGQSSFGESQYPELAKVGVVDESGNLIKSKLRGLVKAFVKDVDEILGESERFEVKWAQASFLYWGKDKFEDEWVRQAAEHTSDGMVYDAVKFIYTSDDEAADMMHEKYKQVDDVGLGNPTTDDLTALWVESEVDLEEEAEVEEGEDEGEETARAKDKWEQFEEEAPSNESDNGSETGGSGSDTTAGDSGNDGATVNNEQQGEGSPDKWEQFEQQAKEESDTGDVQESNADAEEGDESNAGSSDGGSDGAADPDTLTGWADKEGTTDNARDGREPHGSREAKLGDNGGDAEGDEPEGEGHSSGGRGVSHTKRRGGGKDKRTAETGDVECEDGGRPHEIKWPDVEPIDGFERNRIYEGNTFEWALKLPENSVDTIVTSPPYYNLRDYDIDDAYPISGDWTCDHEFDGEFCVKCGCFLGQLGAEPDPATFIDHIVDLMDRYKRVLKPTGSLWLNIGDTYSGSNIDGRVKAGNKSRIMVPERIYRRMVQTGWHLRDYVIWAKKVWMPDDDLRGNGKPFSSSSRLADQWEPMVRLTPQDSPYTDVDSNRLRPPSFSGDMGTEGSEGKFRKGEDTQRGKTYNPMGTNPPDVWLINSDGYQGDHRAVYPEELPARCVNLTTPDRVCENCGEPYHKEVTVKSENTVSAGGDGAEYEQVCNCNAGHEPGVAFDPFLGSGTTAVAAANNGFDWAGVELSEKYQELARERIPTGRQVGLGDY